MSGLTRMTSCLAIGAALTSCSTTSGGGGSEYRSDRTTSAVWPPSADKGSASRSSAAIIVGRWEQVHRCGALERVLNRAGLEAIAPAVIGDHFPDTSPRQLARKPDLCRGATAQYKSHFFRKNGKFGSLDQHDRQVDDGTYEVLDHHTLRIGDGEFHFRVTTDNTLSLNPLISSIDRRKALARPFEFSTAGWQMAVAYEGHPWRGIPCKGWC